MCPHLSLRKIQLLGGGEYTLNTIADKDNVKVTKGDLKTYTYSGDSGYSASSALYVWHFPAFPSIAQPQTPKISP